MSTEGPRPAIVLVAPQLGQNIGACARAMLNCGLDELRLVRPREGWPNPRARAAATEKAAAEVIDRAVVYESTAEAVADLEWLYATTARARDLKKPVVGPDQAAAELRRAALLGERGGILFGPERAGLDSDDVALAGKLVHLPTNPRFSSLNLAQAVLLVGWEWLSAGTGGSEAVDPSGEPQSGEKAEPRATSGELENLFSHLEQALDEAGFFRVPEMRSVQVRKMRSLFHRAELHADEVRMLHGMVARLSGRRMDGRPVRAPRQRPSPSRPSDDDESD